MIQNQTIRRNKIIVWLSIGFYILSLTQQCYCTPVFCGYSLMALLTGPSGLVFGGAALTWLANPLLFTSWIMANKSPKISLVMSLLAALVSFSFLLFNKIIADEAGNYLPIKVYKSGYWLWCTSSSILLIGNIIIYRLNRTRSVQFNLR